jgi:hypothetical protein
MNFTKIIDITDYIENQRLIFTEIFSVRFMIADVVNYGDIIVIFTSVWIYKVIIRG